MVGEITKQLIRLALEEDIGSGDITSEATISEQARGRAVIMAKERLVVCGQAVCAAVYRELSEEIRYESIAADGVRVNAGAVLSRVSGPLRLLLSGERVALNFLQRLCGIATLTADVVSRVEGSGVRILDTRKTTPGWRELEKYAVKTGGGVNHRRGLFDAVLIKNNHIDALGGDIARAVRCCREKVQAGIKVEVEVRNEAELGKAMEGRPDAILLDNISPEEIAQAVQLVRAQAHGADIELEASGGIDEQNVAIYARTGIDSISLGMLTHSVRASDIALRYEGAAAEQSG